MTKQNADVKQFHTLTFEVYATNKPSSIFGTFHYHFQVYQDATLKLVSKQYGAWSDCNNFPLF